VGVPNKTGARHSADEVGRYESFEDAVLAALMSFTYVE
jgi:hypothetical protein